MLSERAQRYLDRLERRPHVTDLGAVRGALATAGVPATDPLLEFHDRFAGYVKPRPDEFVWGLVHEAPKWLAPMAIDVIVDTGRQYVICADGHPSYDLRLDDRGVHYTTCVVPQATSFARKVEQDALVGEFLDAHPDAISRQLEVSNDRRELADVLVPRLAAAVVDEVSDIYGRIYATPELVLVHYIEFSYFMVFVARGTNPAELRDFRWNPDHRRSLAEIETDLGSPYDSRRYQAVLELRNTTDPASARLFRIALRDSNDRTQMYAIEGLRKLDCREAIPELIAVLDPASPTKGPITFAIAALEEMADPAALHPIARMTEHANKFVRRTAVLALARIGNLSVIPALERLSGDHDVPMAGPTGDKLSIAALAADAIAKIRSR